MDPYKPTQHPEIPPMDFISVPNNTPKTSLATHFMEFFQTFVVFAAIASTIYLFVAQPHKVSGLSMFPNFHHGDYIITDKVSYKFGEPKKGDVVVFKNPKNSDEDFIKRIMAVPGDKIKVEDGSVFVNSKRLKEPYLKTDIFTESKSFLREGEEVKIADGTYIVMGDNRPNSSDSREWGPITKKEIIGKVMVRYWPKDAIGLYPAAYSYQEDQ